MNMTSNSSLKKSINKSILMLPTPSSISYLWNWGSLLGVSLMIQIITGILLSSHYNSDINKAFESVIMITKNINFGYEMRFFHMNMASLFFIILFVHISRSIFTASYKLKSTWTLGVMIILILMATAFLGYVLPWGQMSFWGATVITNLLSAIPYVGKTIVEWVWGSFSIEKATLNRFFSLHFIAPMVLTVMVLIHLTFLHKTGSNKPVGTQQTFDMMNFHPFFSSKDVPSLILMVTSLSYCSLVVPFAMGDPENFNMANPLNTPIHIQPEWYFLFAYAILRSIPSKLGGVVALFSSIAFLFLMPPKKKLKSSKKWMPEMKKSFWMFCASFALLTWAGAMPVEKPFEETSKMLSSVYFTLMTLI